MDSINREILSHLQRNARMSNAAIGRLINMSSPAVAERIRKMEDLGIIKGYQAQIDPLTLGYQMKAIITLKAFMGKLKPFLEAVKQWDEVVNCYRVTGNENIVMVVTLRNQQHLERFIDQIIGYGESKTQIVLSKVVDGNPIL